MAYLNIDTWGGKHQRLIAKLATGLGGLGILNTMYGWAPKLSFNFEILGFLPIGWIFAAANIFLFILFWRKRL